MKLDMSFCGIDNDWRYIAAISFNHVLKQYGWKLIVPSGQSELDQICIDKGMDKEGDSFILTAGAQVICDRKAADIFTKTSKNTKPHYIKNAEMLYSLLGGFDKVVFYTGAGLSKDAGIWDLKELRKHLFLDDINSVLDRAASNKEYFLNVCRSFCDQLYLSKPTQGHYLLKVIQHAHECYIMTENRDVLHQKTGAMVITRDEFAKKAVLLAGKRLIVVGVSYDHSGLISLYRKLNKKHNIFVICKDELPDYLTEEDYYYDGDAQQLIWDLCRKEGMV